jgi:asparagine synthase (glutamine-hydrolysing)
MPVIISAKKNNFWTEVRKGSTIIWYKGYFFNFSISSIISKCAFLECKEIGSFIKSIDGHFAIIVQRFDMTFMAVDKVRSTPLYYTKVRDSFFIDYNPKNLVKNEFDKTINQNSKLEISMSGYTIGSKTIYQNLYSLKAGEIIFFSNGIARTLKYHKYFNSINKKSFEDFKNELSELTLNIFRKTIDSIGDRQVVIPLSAGNDSRLVASIFKHLGFKNVKCFTYGIKDNFEANISKKISQKLNYDWIFVDLNDHLINSVFNTSRISEYFDYYETFNSCPCIQGLLSLEYLKVMIW